MYERQRAEDEKVLHLVGRAASKDQRTFKLLTQCFCVSFNFDDTICYMQEQALKNLLKEMEGLIVELQGARTELIKVDAIFGNMQKYQVKELKLIKGVLLHLQGFNAWHDDKNSSIGIKHMGEIDVNMLIRSCSERFEARQAEFKALALCRMWQEKLQNPEQKPYSSRVMELQGKSKGKTRGSYKLRHPQCEQKT